MTGLCRARAPPDAPLSERLEPSLAVLHFGPEQSVHGLGRSGCLPYFGQRLYTCSGRRGLTMGERPQRKRQLDLLPKQKEEASDALEDQGVEPCTSRMLSERSADELDPRFGVKAR